MTFAPAPAAPPPPPAEEEKGKGAGKEAARGGGGGGNGGPLTPTPGPPPPPSDDEEHEPPPNRLSLPVDWLPPPVRTPTRRGGMRPVTYAYVEGCAPALGGAVVLRGGGFEELKVRALVWAMGTISVSIHWNAWAAYVHRHTHDAAPKTPQQPTTQHTHTTHKHRR